MGKSKQVFSAPVYGLTLGPQVSGEVKVGRVTFVASEKIPRIRKRLGLKHPVSHYRQKLCRSDYAIFTNAESYAFLRTTRDPSSDNVSQEFKQVQSAFWLLASSFAGYSKREHAALSLRQPANSSSVRDTAIFDSSGGGYHVSYRFNVTRQANRCDRFWVQNSQNGHFKNLQEILDGKRKVKHGWNYCIRRAATLFGQSYLAHHVAEAFTYDMIAIETLLCKQGDKFPDALIERIVAIFGWMTSEDREPWHESVTRLYKLRCGYVHDGKSGEITGMDLHFADTLVQNILTNICSNTQYIKSKDDIINLTERLAAYRTLGMKARRPPRFTYSRDCVSDADAEKVNDTSKWEW